MQHFRKYSLSFCHFLFSRFLFNLIIFDSSMFINLIQNPLVYISVTYAVTSTLLNYDFVSENSVESYENFQIISLRDLSPKFLWNPHVYKRIYNPLKRPSSQVILSNKIILYEKLRKMITKIIFSKFSHIFFQVVSVVHIKVFLK